MPNKQPPSDSAGPMGMQPLQRGASTPTQTLPKMPGANADVEGAKQGQAKTPAPGKGPRTRKEAVRAALAKITRRNSLRKQRDAQKS
jgi:hypothetical protein